MYHCGRYASVVAAIVEIGALPGQFAEPIFSGDFGVVGRAILICPMIAIPTTRRAFDIIDGVKAADYLRFPATARAGNAVSSGKLDNRAHISSLLPQFGSVQARAVPSDYYGAR